MALNDSEENISMLLDVTGHQLTRDQAVQLLRNSNGNVEQAMNKWFDKGSSALVDDQAWDSSAFAADRYGQVEDTIGGSNIPSFNIEYAPGVDNYPHSGAHSTAPTRPPSRTSNRSPAQTGDAPIPSIENGQESGVIGNSRPVFGPATKEHYDSTKWAMVPMSTNIEYIPDVAPSQRKREENGPAIIKPLPSGDYLPALITILHSIPLFRNALLMPDVSLGDYAAGTDWWKGDPSGGSRTIEHGSDSELQEKLDIIHEMQRLMAFLDNTERAYGSAGGLLQLDAWKESKLAVERSEDGMLRFLVSWGQAFEDQIGSSLNGVLRSVVNAGGENHESFLLDATAVNRESGTELTLYDVLDDNLFASAAGNAHITDLSNVLILRLENSKADAERLDCRIPATFYADRYLEENKGVVDTVLMEMKRYEDQMKEINDEAYKLKYHTAQTVRKGEQMETLKLLKSSIVAFQPKEDDLIEDPNNIAILSQLQSIYDSIERKLNNLEEHKTKAREEMDSIAKRFQAPIEDVLEPSTEPHQNNEHLTNEPSEKDAEEGKTQPKQIRQPLQHSFKHPYKLCGVSTRPSVVYLLHPDINSNVPSANQWWRIEYTTATSEAYILRDRVTLPDVLKKASSESRSALLIYANEAATSATPLPLSSPLRTFINADNVAFMEELQNDLNYGPTTSADSVALWDEGPSQYAPPDYETDWNTMGAGEFHSQNKVQTAASSTTLTPNTEMEEEGMEMREVNSGMDGWTSLASGASSATVGGEAMDVVESQRPQQQSSTLAAAPAGTVNPRDVEMVDVDLGGGGTRTEGAGSGVQHVEK